MEHWRHKSEASESLRTFFEGSKHGGLVSWALRLDKDKNIRWVGGRYVLWMPPDVLRRTAEEQMQGLLPAQQQDLLLL